MQDVRGVLNAINMNIFPTITNCFFRDKTVELVCVNKAEIMKIEEKLKQIESVDEIINIRVKNRKY